MELELLDIPKELKKDGVGGCKTEEKQVKGNKGNDGINRQTGGGASGGAQPYGAYGNSEYGDITSSNRIHNVYAYGGAGGRGTSYSGGNSGQSAGGGPDKNNVNRYIYGAAGSNLGGEGGGLLIIYANSILNNNKILSNGRFGQYGNGTGGGSINIFYKEQITEGTIQATKGGNGGGYYGAEGGNGTVTIQKLSIVSSYATLTSNGIIEAELEIAPDALGKNAYDGDKSTTEDCNAQAPSYTGLTKILKLDSSVIGKKLIVSGEFMAGGIVFRDKNKQNITTESIEHNATFITYEPLIGSYLRYDNLDISVIIPEGATEVVMVDGSSMYDNSILVSEITIEEVAK